MATSKAAGPGNDHSMAKASRFFQDFKSRRTIYTIGSEQRISDQDLIVLIESAVRESSTALNSQTSRVVVLLGEHHRRYWAEMILPSLEKVMPEARFNFMKPKINAFAGGYGTVIFYEDKKVIEAMQEKTPAFKDQFPIWSHYTSGMAQVICWTALELAGYGASLQHMGGIVQKVLAEQIAMPESWTFNAELVFGSVQEPAGEKTYMDNEDRFMIFGAT